MTVLVTAPGPMSLLQDGGRPGLGHLGVSTSGAFDRRALRQANTLVGNPPTATVIEIALGDMAVTAQEDHVVAVTGAVGPVTVDGSPVTHGRAVRLRAGQTLSVAYLTSGLRAYLAVGGGWDVPTVLGSASTDTLAGLGPAPLAAGDLLTTGVSPPTPALEDVPSLTSGTEIVLDVMLGPRDDWFTPAGVRTLLDTAWVISSSSNRIGGRLDGPAIERARTGELASEPCVRGSIQVAADGRPIVFGPDHPVTGGYPVIAVVTDADTDRLAQARPGAAVRFRRGSSS